MAGLQPEPAVIATAFDTLRQQSERMANVGPLQDHQNLMLAIEALGQRMDNRFNVFENRQTNLDIAILNSRRFASNTAGALLPLVDIHNGGAVPNFPATLIQLHALNGMSSPIQTRYISTRLTQPPLTYRSHYQCHSARHRHPFCS
jgi:hypothetical protein